MLLKKFVVGPLETNCYVFGDEESREVVVIDPGGEVRQVHSFIQKNHLTVKYVINTHGHGDHIGANGSFAAAILVHKIDKDLLHDPHLNLSESFGTRIASPQATRLLDDGDTVQVGRLTLEVIHTPGHTPGGICLRHDNVLFSGDTLFFEGVGRTDLPNGSSSALISSIKSRLMTLPDDCKVYPGHGPQTTIGHEREFNPFI